MSHAMLSHRCNSYRYIAHSVWTDGHARNGASALFRDTNNEPGADDLQFAAAVQGDAPAADGRTTNLDKAGSHR